MSLEELTLNEALDVYYYLYLTRRFEETLIKLYHSGRLSGHPHSSIGQEAIGVGSVYCLKKTDLICPSLRTIGSILTKGIDLKQLMAEVFRKKNSPSGGRWLYHHVSAPDLGIILGSAVVAASVPVAVGASFASRMNGTDQVTLAYFGDGASSRGDVHEAINFASVFKLPVVFICENNMYALSTPQSRQMNITNLSDRAIGYGIPGVTADGCDVLEVIRETSKAIDRARKGDGPTLLEFKTYRLRAHSEIDPPDMDRPETELETWRKKCRPVTMFRNSILAKYGSCDDKIEKIESGVEKQLEEAVEFASSEPEPDPADALQNVYAIMKE